MRAAALDALWGERWVLGEGVLRFEGSSPGIAELAARAREEL